MSGGTLPRRGVCLVLASPGGGGKSTIARALVANDPMLTLSVSVTTRAPRPDEQEGVHYYFRSRAEFDALAGSGALLEWAEVFGRGYGTPRAPVEEALRAGRDLVFDIDWQGFRQLRAALPGDVVGVFILPPSLETLRARLVGRGSDGAAEIARRMQGARDEIAHAGEFDHLIVNDGLDASIERTRAILDASRHATSRQTGLADYLDRIARET